MLNTGFIIFVPRLVSILKWQKIKEMFFCHAQKQSNCFRSTLLFSKSVLFQYVLDNYLTSLSRNSSLCVYQRIIFFPAYVSFRSYPVSSFGIFNLPIKHETFSLVSFTWSCLVRRKQIKNRLFWTLTWLLLNLILIHENLFEKKA